MPYRTSEDGVHIRGSEAQSIGYSDGELVEREILRIVRDADDLTSLSEELQAAAHDWPTEYHLSRQRHVLIRPIGIRPGQRVLELGAGCGAITRYLGELGAHVDAVEGTLNRAKIAAARTHDLPNVKVFCDDLMAFESDSKYDWVLLIGVLEYSPMFVSAQEPITAVLRKAREHLKDQGRLVIAIENRMGLKYLNGANEDHLGIPFVGVEQRYGKTEATTLSRTQLLDRLSQIGLTETAVLLPFPDYKLPATIINSEAVHHGVRLADVLLFSKSNDYLAGRNSSFNEELVRRSIADSTLLQELAESFLIIAGARSAGRISDDGLVWHYSLGTRKSAFACETLISRNSHSSDMLFVAKRRLDGNSRDRAFQDGRYRHRVSAADFRDGSTIASQFVGALTQCGMAERRRIVKEFVSEYVRCLHVLTGCRPEMSTSVTGIRVDGGLFDCIPRNIVVDRRRDPTPSIIDQEWVAQGEVRLSRLLYRGALDFQRAGSIVVEGNGLNDEIRAAFRFYGLDDSAWEQHAAEERDFQVGVMPDHRIYVGDYTARMSFSESRRTLEAERDGLLAELGGVVAERDGLVAELGGVVAELGGVVAELGGVVAERDGLVAERDWWFGEFHRLRARRSVRFVLAVAGRLGRLRGLLRRGSDGIKP